MNHTANDLDQIEDETSIYEASDEVLEAAAGKASESVKALTLSFCSGLDTCPG